MKNSLFNPENWIWQPFGKVADFLILSALWLFSSIPLVTVGAACTALYDCSSHCVKDGERDMFSRYFKTFRAELVPATVSTVLWAAVLGLLYWLIRSFTAVLEATTFNMVLSYGLLMILAFVAGVCSWVFPLLSRFTFNVSGLNVTALRLAMGHLPRTIALAAVNVAGGYLCVRFWLPVMIVPGIVSLLSAYILDPVFRKYEEQESL